MARVDWDSSAMRDIAGLAWDAWLDANQDTILSTVQDETPVATGNMKENTDAQRIPDSSGFDTLRISANTDYAIIVHNGRREVYPVNATVLRWFDALGHAVFATKSKAVPPNPWIVRSLQGLGFRVTVQSG